MVISDPAPAAPLRSLIARCLVRLYDRGDTRSLFDTLAGLQGLLAKHLPLPSPPSGPPTAIKLYATRFLRALRITVLILTHYRSLLQSIGLLTEAHGSKLLSLFPESLGLALKALKGARDADIPLRHAALIALSRSITGAGRSTPEQSLKEILKYARSGLTDKYAIIKRASAGVCLPKCLTNV